MRVGFATRSIWHLAVRTTPGCALRSPIVTMPIEYGLLSTPPFDSDSSLAAAASSGSIPAWHEFLKRYSTLIFSVVRRHLVSENEDDVRSVYVDVLEALYTTELSKYRDDVELTTWLIVFTRSRSLDFFRKRHGRYRKPEGYDKLTDFEKKVLELYFVKRLPLAVVLHVLRSTGFAATVEDIVKASARINDVIDARYLKRIELQCEAEREGLESARMLKYLLECQLEQDERARTSSPDYRLMEEAAQARIDRVKTMVAALSPCEREILELRFTERLTAKEIAGRLNLGGQRRAFTRIDRIVRKLRRAMETGGQV